MSTLHPAEIFRNLRVKFFAIAAKYTFKSAYYILDKEKGEGKIGDREYHGLIAEMVFLEQAGNKLDLSPTLDCGDHCDFRGTYEFRKSLWHVHLCLLLA